MRTFWIPTHWWPNIPSAPRPAEGRIYPLNNHAHYAHMNRSEYRLREWMLSCSPPVVVLAPGAFRYFADLFGELCRRRLYGRPQDF